MKTTKKDKRRLFFWSLLILIICSYLGVFIFDSWSKILENNKLKESLAKQYEELLESEKKLNGESIKLQDPDYVAKFAREKYMYSKEGEMIIRITDWNFNENMLKFFYGVVIGFDRVLRILFANGGWT